VKDLPNRLIVDANIIFSALIKDSITRRLIIELPTTLYAPGMIIEEILHHKKLICNKSGLSEKDIESILNTTLSYVNIVSADRYSNQLQRAYDIMNDIDPNDTPYIALALSLASSSIWSEDKDFQKQKTIEIWTTKELIDKLK
jgi:predicted nucleic acid-binding protein